MIAISLWQPWASLIADGRKKVETRHWSPPKMYAGTRIAIHAARKIDKEAARDFGYDPETIPRGALVATVVLIGWIQFTEENVMQFSAEEKLYGDFHCERYGWFLRDAIKLDPPVPCKGLQKFFFVKEV